MKSALLATAALVAACAATSAHAQDATWTGPYVGAHAGWGWQSDKNSETVGFDNNQDGQFNDTVNTAAGANAFSPGFCGGGKATASPATGCGDEDDGFEFGGRLGYDMQFGSFVVGALVEGSRTDVSDAVTAYSTTPAFYTMDRKLKGLAAIRARAGVAAGDNLFYVTGGGALGDVKHSFNTSNTANTFTTTEDDDSVKGYQLGGGVERKMTPEISVGLEYIFTRLDDDGHVVRAGGPAPATNPFLLVNSAGTDFKRSNENFDVHSVRLTANYRF